MRILAFLGLFALFACNAEERTPQTFVEEDQHTAAPLSLPAYLDCLRTEGRMHLAAHRAGPGPGRPENTLAAMQHSYDKTGAFLEVDIATSEDGVLFLHHDDRLERTTTGRGIAAQTPWSTLRTLSTKDPSGGVTAHGLVKLTDALAWAEGKTVLELDIKRSTDYDDVARVVKDADAEERIILIAYSLNAAAAMSQRLPNSVISVPVSSVQELDEVHTAGIRPDRTLIWLGTEEPQFALDAALADRGIETVFGTLGGSQSLDRQWAASGSDHKYAELAEGGIELLATDRPEAAFEILTSAGLAGTSHPCRYSVSGP
ncbi:glycerophosphoryl diester phosphodiesterase [Parvularcula bermudensis HTCC2503]|uniref:Glycerophosphoryl diester phosphodiesterase n=1 Tax=Parvularcula bermudensis (strain ATCC BAA-594 / HTCC2503 / KCTC 12087) TaxID=314260 RepID=E0TES5_PARBH|nr:glycerophosphodiester phosphodiesterase family protein [Parvularcula bermudensis]ADM08958.1 glycerophosphoryl diester phosphodiesterase [Parvularcula bermudensis HTCC2503]